MKLSVLPMCSLTARELDGGMTSNTRNAMNTLVLGGTGKTGRRVAERLTARGVPTLIGSRSGGSPFDWNDRATWEPALRDVRAVYVAFSPDLAVPGSVGTVGAFAELAVAQGTRRLVLLSGRGEREAELAEHEVPEDAVWLLTYLFTELFDGRNAQVSDGVQRALGRAPRDFTDFARDAAATGIWGA